MVIRLTLTFRAFTLLQEDTLHPRDMYPRPDSSASEDVMGFAGTRSGRQIRTLLSEHYGNPSLQDDFKTIRSLTFLKREVRLSSFSTQI